MPKIHWTIEYEVKGMANRFTHILRAPHQVSFDITNKCNLRCLHCFNSSGENDVVKNELSDEEVLSFIRSLVPMQLYNVCFCGADFLMSCNTIIDRLGAKALRNTLQHGNKWYSGYR